MENNKIKDKKKLITAIIITILIVSILGGTLAYYDWKSTEAQKTAVTVTLEPTFECAIDGGGPIESSNYQLIPTNCDANSEYVIKREVKVKPTLDNDENSILFDVWINVNKLTTGLSNNEHFKYALTTSSTSCIEGVVASGNFNGLLNDGTAENIKTETILSNTYDSTTEDTYYLYIWLDREAGAETMNQEFSLSLNGQCTNEGQKYTVTFDANGGELAEIYHTSGQSTYITPIEGNYKIELWGAQGGVESTSSGAYGAYTSGNISLTAGEKLYFYVGENYNGYKNSFTFNGGGKGSYSTTGDSYNYNGGGATDVRYFGSYTPTIEDLNWNSTLGLNSRIMVAAGGGGYVSWFSSGGGNKTGGSAGGLIGYSGTSLYTTTNATGGTQISGGIAENNVSTLPYIGVFGIGGYGTPYSAEYIYHAGGGGGYYGGATAGNSKVGSASGGSSYISGHTGCVAITSSSNRTPKNGCTTGTLDNSCSLHYSGKSFSNTLMIDGNGYKWTTAKGSLQQMPKFSGGYYDSGNGNVGSGAAKVTLLTNTKTVTVGSTYGELPIPMKTVSTFIEWNTKADGSGETITNDSIVNLSGDTTIYAIWEGSI